MVAPNESRLGDTVDLGPGDAAQRSAYAPPGTRLRVDYAALSDKGLVRPNNEDHFLVARFGRSLEPLLTNLPPERIPKLFAEDGLGMVVADGIGGGAAGEVASAVAITTLLNMVFETPDWIFSTSGQHLERVMERMEERFRQIDAALLEQSREDVRLAGMGTTMTLACSLGANLVLTHVGDSRAYLLRGDKLHQLTKDHTLARSLVDLGILRHEAEATDRVRHALTRALGGKGRQCEAEVQRLTLSDGDQVLLCTDGLTDMVDDAAIASLLGKGATANDACRALVERALSQGGKDNVTVALVRYRF